MDDSQSESTDFPQKISEEHQIVKKIRIQNENIETNLLENRNQSQNQHLLKEKEDSQTILSQSIIIPVSNEGLSNLDNKNRRKTKIYSVNGNIDFQTEYKNDPASYIDTYKSLKYKGKSYQLNDNLLIKNEADAANDFVCKLTRIIRPINLDSSKVLAFLEVQWYYKKGDLQTKKYTSYLDHFSENEVFLTNQKDFVLVDCVNGPAEVLTYEEYDSLSKINPHTFFSRSKFDIVKKKLIPPIEKWEKHCICKTPLNPDYMYVQCDKCNMWYHIMCLGFSVEEAQAMESYICKECQYEGKSNDGETKDEALSK